MRRTTTTTRFSHHTMVWIRVVKIPNNFSNRIVFFEPKMVFNFLLCNITKKLDFCVKLCKQSRLSFRAKNFWFKIVDIFRVSRHPDLDKERESWKSLTFLIETQQFSNLLQLWKIDFRPDFRDTFKTSFISTKCWFQKHDQGEVKNFKTFFMKVIKKLWRLYCGFIVEIFFSKNENIFRLQLRKVPAIWNILHCVLYEIYYGIYLKIVFVRSILIFQL